MARTSPRWMVDDSSLLEQVAATISRYNMLAPGARVIVAVSGGPDSVCLLHVLRELRIPVAGVAHVNHKLRGEASEADQRFVADLARDLGLEFYSADRVCDGGNLEQTARRTRREFFHSLIADGRGDCVALGHTRDDQAETVLFRMLRGSGLAGLAGILPVTAEGLVRPLLGVTRSEVEAFLRQRGIGWREDASNRDPRFARNRIRHDLLPGLQRDWNPRLDEALAHLADLAYEEERWWAAEVARYARQLLVISPGAVEAPAGELAKLPRSLARRLIRHAIREAKGSLRGVEFRHIEDVLGLPETGGRAELPGIRAMRSFDWVRLEVPGSTPRLGAGQVSVPGQRLAPDGNTMICLEVIRQKQEPKGCATLKSDLYFRTIPERLFLRGWKPGDRYRPVGHAGDWKLKELFQRMRIPSWRRPFWPILCMGDKILWARDFGPAAEYADNGGPCQLRIREIPAPN
ncbi:MAG TPA: tRNA lysidine(34) synthetase TilS [Bryobacteraceae bacterium]|nr:tRNA lysidine(34) synthetase TilS [Bryobacteraceae bacterium]